MIELNLLGANTTEDGRPAVEMKHNISGKFESIFLGMQVEANDSVMFGNLSHLCSCIRVAHGEGRFHFNMTPPRQESRLPPAMHTTAIPAIPMAAKAQLPHFAVLMAVTSLLCPTSSVQSSPGSARHILPITARMMLQSAGCIYQCP